MKPTRAVYSNDRSAPRMRKAEFTTQIVNKELWQQFKKDFPEHKGMTWSEFIKKWGHLAETIRIETVSNPLGVKLGSYTGELKLQYLDSKFEGHDIPTSTVLGEKVNHVNLTSRGKIAKLKWERRWAVKFNKMLQFFAFEETREINAMAKKHIDNNPDKLRAARNTLGGFSIWRQLKKNG